MANVDRPSGFQPKGTVLRETPYTAGGTIYPGDAVTLNSSGLVVVAAAGQALLGVSRDYAVSTGEVCVFDHPDQLFFVQADETQVDAQTDIGNVCDIVATAGDSTYRASRMELDSSDVNTTSGQLMILGIERRVGNALGTNCTCLVRINEHFLANASAGI